MREAADPPKAKASAATSAPPTCQPRSRKKRITPAPPAYSSANTSTSLSHGLGRGTSSATIKCKGEKISDCGSAICGQPAKMLDVQNGDWPVASERARNASCG